jgi:hypothetical protein
MRISTAEQIDNETRWIVGDNRLEDIANQCAEAIPDEWNVDRVIDVHITEDDQRYAERTIRKAQKEQGIR